LIARLANGVISDSTEPAFLLGKAEDVIVNPFFQAEKQRLLLGRFQPSPLFVFEESRTALVEGFDQPIRAFPLIGASHLNVMTALILAAGIADSLVMASCGGLMVKTLTAAEQGKASAWTEAGQLGGGALGGAVVIWLAARVPAAAVGLVLGILIVLPAFVALTIAEPLPALRRGSAVASLWWGKRFEPWFEYLSGAGVLSCSFLSQELALPWGFYRQSLLTTVWVRPGSCG